MTTRALTIPDASRREMIRTEASGPTLRAFGLDWQVAKVTRHGDGMTTLILSYEEQER